VNDYSSQQLAVLVDGAQVAPITPSSTKYLSYPASSLAIATSGMHTIEFLGLDSHGGNSNAFLDNVHIASA
jgi:hypothetical protein